MYNTNGSIILLILTLQCISFIPFAMNESTRFISPTKTPEYLAAGKPVISSPIKDVVSPYGDNKLVHIASNVEEFIKEVQSWKTGLPTEDGVYIGPLTRQGQLEILEDQIADAIKKGAVVLTGGKRKSGKGYYFEPTVLINVTNDMRVMREESFGPVIGIMKVKNDEKNYLSLLFVTLNKNKNCAL